MSIQNLEQIELSNVKLPITFKSKQFYPGFYSDKYTPTINLFLTSDMKLFQLIQSIEPSLLKSYENEYGKQWFIKLKLSDTTKIYNTDKTECRISKKKRYDYCPILTIKPYSFKGKTGICIKMEQCMIREQVKTEQLCMFD